MRGCGRWRGARPGLADAAGGFDAAGVILKELSIKIYFNKHILANALLSHNRFFKFRCLIAT